MKGTAGGVSGLPHDIHGLIAPEPDYNMLLIYGGIAAGLVMVLIYLAVRYKAYLAKKRLKTTVTVDPWAELKERLQRLEPKVPFDALAQEDFFFELSMRLREAIEMRSGVRATDLTLRELTPLLQQRLPMGREETEAVLRFLSEADLVKFAGKAATRDEALKTKAQVKGWIVHLTPPLSSAVGQSEIVSHAACEKTLPSERAMNIKETLS